MVTLDGDMQNDPRDIPRLLNCLVFGEKGEAPGTSSSTLQSARGTGGVPGLEGEELAGNGAGAEADRDEVPRSGGYDVVCGWRKNRQDDALTRHLPSFIANALIAHMTGVCILSPPLCMTSSQD